MLGRGALLEAGRGRRAPPLGGTVVDRVARIGVGLGVLARRRALRLLEAGDGLRTGIEVTLERRLLRRRCGELLELLLAVAGDGHQIADQRPGLFEALRGPGPARRRIAC